MGYYEYMDTNLSPETRLILQARWLRQKFLDFQSIWLEDHADFPFAKDWAAYLGINEKSLSAYMNGHRMITKEKAWILCERVEDYSLLEILDYPLPRARRFPIEELPPDLRERLRDALVEISVMLKKRAINSDSDLAKELSSEILERHGFTVTSIKSDGN